MTTTDTFGLYITRLLVNPKHQRAQRELEQPYELHRTLMSLFPELPEPCMDFRHFYGVLHRVETDPVTGFPSIILQSKIAPKEEAVASLGTFLLPRAPGPVTRLLPPPDQFLVPCRSFRFRLRANVTKKVDTKSGPDGKRRNGRRVAVRGEEALRLWLARKEAQHGFRTSVLTRIQAEPDLRGKDKKSALASTLFEGRFVVENPDALGVALQEGIGSAKAYGFGLLSVAPG